jgi:hypothetical protein
MDLIMVDIASTSRASAHVQTERTSTAENATQVQDNTRKEASDSVIERKEVDASTESHVGRQVVKA